MDEFEYQMEELKSRHKKETEDYERIREANIREIRRLHEVCRSNEDYIQYLEGLLNEAGIKYNTETD